MSLRLQVSADDLDRATQVARKLDHVDRLAALAFDLVSRQAEGRRLLSGEAFVAERAETHEVDRDKAQTPYGNLLTILENGPDSNAKYALLSALYVRGFARAYERTKEGQEDERLALVERFADHSEWLELCSSYRVVPLLAKQLDEPQLDAMAQAIGASLLRDDAEDNTVAARARNAARVAMLQALDRPAALERLEAVLAEARDPYSRALARAVLPHGPDSQTALELSGRWGWFPARWPLSLLRWLSGWALLCWLGRAVLWSVGFRRSARVSLAGEALTVERTSHVWGRLVRSSAQVHPVAQLRVARRAARFPLLHSLVGVLSLGAGILLGGLFIFDALRVGELPLLAIGVAFLLGGAGLDLVLTVLIPGGRGRVAVDLDLGHGHRARLSDVPQRDADALLGQLAKLLPSPSQPAGQA